MFSGTDVNGCRGDRDLEHTLIIIIMEFNAHSKISPRRVHLQKLRKKRAKTQDYNSTDHSQNVHS